MSGLTQAVRRKVWWRQFLFQGCWNFEGMQNVGFAYCILPALRHYYRERPEDAERFQGPEAVAALQRYLIDELPERERRGFA